MPSRERRLLDKDKEIRKLKNNLGHYFTNSVVLGIKNEKLKQQLHIAVEALKDIDKTRSVANHKIGTQDKTLNSGNVFCWTTPDEIHNTLEQITALEQKDVK